MNRHSPYGYYPPPQQHQNGYRDIGPIRRHPLYPPPVVFPQKIGTPWYRQRFCFPLPPPPAPLFPIQEQAALQKRLDHYDVSHNSVSNSQSHWPSAHYDTVDDAHPHARDRAYYVSRPAPMICDNSQSLDNEQELLSDDDMDLDDNHDDESLTTEQLLKPLGIDQTTQTENQTDELLTGDTPELSGPLFESLSNGSDFIEPDEINHDDRLDNTDHDSGIDSPPNTANDELPSSSTIELNDDDSEHTEPSDKPVLLSKEQHYRERCKRLIGKLDDAYSAQRLLRKRYKRYQDNNKYQKKRRAAALVQVAELEKSLADKEKLQTHVTELTKELALAHDLIDELKDLIHMMLDGDGFWPGLVVKPSKLKNAGDGLFCSKTIPKGVIIGEYYGDRVFRIEVKDDRYVVWRKKEDGKPQFLFDDTYVVWIKDEFKRDGHWYKNLVEVGIDASGSGNHDTPTPLRKMNHSEENNVAHFVCKNNVVKFYTRQKIKAGAELLWDYDQEIETDFSKRMKHIATDPHKYVYVDKNNKVCLKEKYKRLKDRRVTSQ
ncbi:SET domain-containing protein-lysine N-methyltransferase [Parendozoicomonas haliclonae]|uniref:SET domain protein n=1 Tax=Parendozoicomonas haliclonae TaxID=1960125 RepID=A0A1X7ARL3_9GAMM|nr:SET domain-containing protein-lysine N-methyltransferase [Parendozoicomonas haliclonae]SMA50782.1 SET domain protein [Parendozoicomonas haliclonae]